MKKRTKELNLEKECDVISTFLGCDAWARKNGYRIDITSNTISMIIPRKPFDTVITYVKSIYDLRMFINGMRCDIKKLKDD